MQDRGEEAVHVELPGLDAVASALSKSLRRKDAGDLFFHVLDNNNGDHDDEKAYCTVWQTSPPSSLTPQPVSRLRLKLATLSQILIQAEGEAKVVGLDWSRVELVEWSRVGLDCTRAKAEWLWSRHTTEPLGVATTIEALKSVITGE